MEHRSFTRAWPGVIGLGLLLIPGPQGHNVSRADDEWIAEFVQPCVGPPVCLFLFEVVDSGGKTVVTQAYAPRGGCGPHRIRISEIVPARVLMATRPPRLRVWSISCRGVRSLEHDWILVDPDPLCGGMSLTSNDGDANNDGQVDLSDAIYLTYYLYLGGPHACLNAADVNNDAELDLSDVIQILHQLFGV